jgi:hypothetical protein
MILLQYYLGVLGGVGGGPHVEDLAHVYLAAQSPILARIVAQHVVVLECEPPLAPEVYHPICKLAQVPVHVFSLCLPFILFLCCEGA